MLWCSLAWISTLPIDLSVIETKSIGGWKGYIGKNMKTGSVSDREHTAFLNMWLEKFIFCGKTVGPTNSNLKLAETLPTGNPVPLGKYLLGSVYHLLHQLSSRLRKEPTDHQLGRPLVVHSVVAAYVHAQNYDSWIVRDRIPIRKLLWRRKNHHSPMHIIWWSSYHDCQWS